MVKRMSKHRRTRKDECEEKTMNIKNLKKEYISATVTDFEPFHNQIWIILSTPTKYSSLIIKA